MPPVGKRARTPGGCVESIEHAPEVIGVRLSPPSRRRRPAREQERGSNKLSKKEKKKEKKSKSKSKEAVGAQERSSDERGKTTIDSILEIGQASVEEYQKTWDDYAADLLSTSSVQVAGGCHLPESPDDRCCTVFTVADFVADDQGNYKALSVSPDCG